MLANGKPVAPRQFSSVAGAQFSSLAAPVSRFTSIDVLKATAIIVVIWIHAFQQFGNTEPLIIRRLAFLTRFAVPAFFFASGFLRAQGRLLPLREFAVHQLARLLVPYFV